MAWFDRITKTMMLVVGVMGLVVIYGGFFYLLFSGRNVAAINWLFLLCPWACIYFGLTPKQQSDVHAWFKRKWTR
ncbi:hypothetical protein FLM48_12825 [Shewanella sp. Scap07]|uniref:hypothetical protein n=1 Tax=Shewanella sp. Scap07 TaxID=2589987 RepID=UPI0015BC3B4E|nr:hypothetical protein [Shewanella sp. Scap07]QLE85869.1 hypothetical protein FLM48_12825 [Shewanella sp. Scap07]